MTYQVDTGASEKHHKTFHVIAMKCWTPPAPAVFLAEDQEMDDLFESNEEIKSKAHSHATYSAHTIERKVQRCHSGRTREDVPGSS